MAIAFLHGTLWVLLGRRKNPRRAWSLLLDEVQNQRNGAVQYDGSRKHVTSQLTPPAVCQNSTTRLQATPPNPQQVRAMLARTFVPQYLTRRIYDASEKPPRY